MSASDPFPSASDPPNAAFTWCSLVLILALPQSISYVAFGVAFLASGKLPEPEEPGPDSEGTRRSPWVAFTHMNTDFLQDIKTRGMKKRLVQLRRFSDKTESAGVYCKSSFLTESYLCSFITYCFPNIQAITAAMKTWIQKALWVSV